MPKKSRKSRTKRKALSGSGPLVAKEIGRRPQPVPLSSRQAAPSKPTTIVNEQEARYYKHGLLDVKRSVVVGVASLLVLLILYFSLR